VISLGKQKMRETAKNDYSAWEIEQ